MTHPPVVHQRPVRWARDNLFSTWYNAAFTLLFAGIAGLAVYRGLRFVFVTGRWTIIQRNLTTLLVGLFPRDHLWRVWAALYVIALALALGAAVVRKRAMIPGPASDEPTASPWSLVRRAWPIITFVLVAFALRPDPTGALLVAGLAVAAYGAWRIGLRAPSRRARMTMGVCIVLIVGAFTILLGFGGVGWDRWGGLLLTMFLATTGILLSFPIGVLLALGRRSSLPLLRAASTGYIELIRGVPLITLLFMASFVIGFLVPPGTPRPTLVTRALIAIVMFTSAYIAEIVRGGLQAVPSEQMEAGLAVGLSPVATMRWIVMPQALRAVIPALVGQFISLFKDTSLVAVIGLTELLRVAQVLTSQRDFVAQQLQAETLIFASFIYWVGSYTMSKESQRLEHRVGVGTR